MDCNMVDGTDSGGCSVLCILDIFVACKEKEKWHVFCTGRD